ncbi:MAG: methyltransferase domain-containing protein [Planctomycetes bacterium]|nr:methyltransferase domain-containing protein [Planctomycetota bacterium]
MQAVVEDAAVDYASAVADGYVSQLAALGLRPEGLTLLELGPGADLGPALLLAGRGARVTVADPWLADCTARHLALYARLAERVESGDAPGHARALRAVLAERRHEAALLTLRASAERLGRAHGLRPCSFDVCFSNAVFEHVASPLRAARRLFTLTRPGGYGLHQVDFRDHRDFARPLEHLTEGPLARALRRVRHRGAQGSGWRHPAYADALRRAGFELLDFEDNLHAAPEYLDEVLPRLRPAFGRLPRATLAVLSGRFVVRRPDGVAA